MRRICLGIALAGGLLAPTPASALTVYAATSLTRAMPEIVDGPTYAFGGSNQLALQIRRGAPADLFLAAEPGEAQALYRARRCERPVTFATNAIALIARAGDPKGIRSVYGLRRGGYRLSVGNAAVPIGDYTRRLLRKLRLTSVISANTVSRQANVGQVVSQVALGAADAGFVYLTDARAQRRRVASLHVPGWAQPPVRYQGCVVRRSGAQARGARALLDRIRSAPGRRVLERHGFGLPARR